MNDLPRAGDNRIVAISLLTAEELRNVGTGLKRIYPLPDQDEIFDDLLARLELASKKPSRGRGRDAQ